MISAWRDTNRVVKVDTTNKTISFAFPSDEANPCVLSKDEFDQIVTYVNGVCPSTPKPVINFVAEST